MTDSVQHQSNILSTLEAALNQPLCVMTNLTEQGLIEVTGDDAVAFLQGQLTNDIKQLGEYVQLNGYCSPKGRLLSIFKTFQIGSAIYLECPVSQQEYVQKRLQMFILRAKVKLNRVNEQWSRIGFAGEALASLLPKLGLTLPIAPNALSMNGDTIIIRLPGEVPRVQVWFTKEDAEKHSATIQELSIPMTEQVWTGFEILAGTPTILPESQELFVPQMVNLDLLNGINFKKGCYTGQEIVARTHYLGKVKRRTMVSILSNAPHHQAPKAGDTLLTQTQQEAGHVVNVAPLNNQTCLMLVEIRLEVLAEKQPIFFNDQEILISETQPYTIPVEV